jgi:hypothetical protein
MLNANLTYIGICLIQSNLWSSDKGEVKREWNFNNVLVDKRKLYYITTLYIRIICLYKEVTIPLGIKMIYIAFKDQNLNRSLFKKKSV